MTTGRVIHAHEATLRTASVDIKSLTVSGRQVTLAVFRQVQSELLVAEPDPELLGLPWGHVNYHPDKCGDDGEHLHVVWQKADELRRAYVSRKVPEWERDERSDLSDIARTLVLKSLLAGEVCKVQNHVITSVRRGMRYDEYRSHICSYAEQFIAGTGSQYVHQALQDHLEKECWSEYLGWTLDELAEEYPRLFKDRERRVQRYQDLYTELAALDQLFIAV